MSLGRMMTWHVLHTMLGLSSLHCATSLMHGWMRRSYQHIKCMCTAHVQLDNISRHHKACMPR